MKWLSGPPDLMLSLRYHSWRDFLRPFTVLRIAPGSEMYKASALPDILLLCFLYMAQIMPRVP